MSSGVDCLKLKFEEFVTKRKKKKKKKVSQ